VPSICRALGRLFFDRTADLKQFIRDLLSQIAASGPTFATAFRTRYNQSDDLPT